MCHKLVTRCASSQQYIDSVLQDQRCASRQMATPFQVTDRLMIQSNLFRGCTTAVLSEDTSYNDKVPHGLPRVARYICPVPLAHAGRDWIFFQTTVEEKVANGKIPESSFERHSRALAACPLKARLDVAPPHFLSDSCYGTRNNSRRTFIEPMPHQIGKMRPPQPNPVPSARPEDAVLIGAHNNNNNNNNNKVGNGSPQASLQPQYEPGTPVVSLLPLDVDSDEAGNYIGIPGFAGEPEFAAPNFAVDTHGASVDAGMSNEEFEANVDQTVADSDVEQMLAGLTNNVPLLLM